MTTDRRQHLGAPKTLEDSLILTLLDLVNHITRNAESIATRADLTVQQWLVLLQVAGDPNFDGPSASASSVGLGSSEIAGARGVSRAHISALVSSLLRKGMLRQVEDPDDRRRRGLVPTERGLRSLHALEPVRHRVNKALFSTFGRKELGITNRLLRACLDRIRNDGVLDSAGDEAGGGS